MLGFVGRAARRIMALIMRSFTFRPPDRCSPDSHGEIGIALFSGGLAATVHTLRLSATPRVARGPAPAPLDKLGAFG